MWKLQRDSATGKLIRDSETGKLQKIFDYTGEVGESCEYCEGTMPKYIKVALSGITYVTNSNCYDCSFYQDISWSGVFDPNGEYILEQDEEYPCTYKLAISCNIVVTRWYSTDGSCSIGVYDTKTYTQALIHVSIEGVDEVYILFEIGGASPGTGYFSSIYAPDTNCLNVSSSSASGSSFWFGCYDVSAGPPYPKMAYGGTATVEEL